MYIYIYHPSEILNMIEYWYWYPIRILHMSDMFYCRYWYQQSCFFVDDSKVSLAPFASRFGASPRCPTMPRCQGSAVNRNQERILRDTSTYSIFTTYLQHLIHCKKCWLMSHNVVDVGRVTAVFKTIQLGKSEVSARHGLLTPLPRTSSTSANLAQHQ